jgi:spore coat polysaccharide biosynthesis protein SpsF (cytidylyltransferase family)
MVHLEVHCRSISSGVLIARYIQKKPRGVGRHCVEAINRISTGVDRVSMNVVTRFIPIQKEYTRSGIVRVNGDDNPATDLNKDVRVFHESSPNLLVILASDAASIADKPEVDV